MLASPMPPLITASLRSPVAPGRSEFVSMFGCMGIGESEAAVAGKMMKDNRRKDKSLNPKEDNSEYQVRSSISLADVRCSACLSLPLPLPLTLHALLLPLAPLVVTPTNSDPISVVDDHCS
eukprot:755597-Hanusia_phi.AAC.2